MEPLTAESSSCIFDSEVERLTLICCRLQGLEAGTKAISEAKVELQTYLIDRGLERRTANNFVAGIFEHLAIANRAPPRDSEEFLIFVDKSGGKSEVLPLHRLRAAVGEVLSQWEYDRDIDIASLNVKQMTDKV